MTTEKVTPLLLDEELRKRVVSLLREKEEACFALLGMSQQLYEARQQIGRMSEERNAMRARIEGMMESMSMACEEPRTGCECAGCMYAREKSGDV